jgi:hypothetical protein
VQGVRYSWYRSSTLTVYGSTDVMDHCSQAAGTPLMGKVWRYFTSVNRARNYTADVSIPRFLIVAIAWFWFYVGSDSFYHFCFPFLLIR